VFANWTSVTSNRTSITECICCLYTSYLVLFQLE